ncbi:MAG: BamA/TamA family outer membrane protein, partial [Gammaproteobacteria bacterium]|nr:BamA/TamA family outer membrane protein [Gammaproteobacteria bacterium]
PAGDSSLAYYKSRISQKSYFPITQEIVFAARGELAYAGAYQDSYLPPYELYRAGGVGSVRGFGAYSLGATPDTFDADGASIGGDMRVLVNAELLFPPPFSSEQESSMRFSLFLDGGNVFNKVNGFDASLLRYSVGGALAWVTPIGPLKFSFGVPVNQEDGDETESFQFTIGVQ